MDDTTRHFSLQQSQKPKNYRHLQADTDQLALLPVRQGCAAKLLVIRDARGTGKNDHVLWGNLR